MKLTVNIHQRLLLTWLDFEGQMSRSQQAIEVVKTSMSRLVEGHLLIGHEVTYEGVSY